MNKYKYIYILPMAIGISFTLAACSGKQTENKDELRVLVDGTIEYNGIHKMQVLNSERKITFKGKDYESVINRIPNDSLPRVKNEMGDVFLDNEIVLKIMQGSSKVFAKKFTKQSFSSIVPGEFLRNSILEGMVFDKATAKGFVYAVSVNYPQTDLYFPVSLTIAVDGTMSMEKEELLEEYWEE